MNGIGLMETSISFNTAGIGVVLAENEFAVGSTVSVDLFVSNPTDYDWTYTVLCWLGSLVIIPQTNIAVPAHQYRKLTNPAFTFPTETGIYTPQGEAWESASGDYLGAVDFPQIILVDVLSLLHGTVRDADTLAPLAGVTVAVTWGYSTFTDSNGYYTIPGIEIGERVVTYNLEGYVLYSPPVNPVFDGSDVEINVNLVPAVEPAVINAFVRDAATLTPIEGALVQLRQSANANWDYEEYTDATGWVLGMAVLVDAVYTMRITKDGYEPSEQQTRAVAGQLNWGANLVPITATYEMTMDWGESVTPPGDDGVVWDFPYGTNQDPTAYWERIYTGENVSLLDISIPPEIAAIHHIVDGTTYSFYPLAPGISTLLTLETDKTYLVVVTDPLTWVIGA